MKTLKKILLTPTSNECIETMARKKYWSLIEDYTKTEAIDKGKEIEIEMLRRYLEETDVEKLRSETENRLSKGEKTQVILQLDDKGVLKVRIL